MTEGGEQPGVDFASATGIPFPEGFKKDSQIPLWWRRISSQVFESEKRKYLDSGMFPVSRMDVEEEIRALLEAEFQTPLYIGRHHRPVLLAVLEALDRKLSFIIKLALAEVPRLTPTQVHISPKGLAFWDAGSTLAVHDLLEMQIPIFSGYPLLVRCFARVARILPDANRGMVQVICRYEPSGGAMVQEPRPLARLPVVPSPPLPREETPPPPLPPQPAAPPPEVPHDAVSAGNRAHNRRQSFRINGIVPISWRLIDPREFEAIYKEYQSSRKLLQRDWDYRYQERIISLDFHITRLEETHHKVLRPMQYLRQQVDLLCRRANTGTEEKFYLDMMQQLEIMAAELVQAAEISQKLSNQMLFIKGRMELQLERDRFTFRTDPKKKQELPLQLKKLGREIDKGMPECQQVSHAFHEAVLQLLDSLNTMDTSADDLHADGDDPNGTIISRLVNISVSGLAFRTKKQDIQRGDILEFRLGLVPEGEVPSPREFQYCYGKVMLIKEPDIEKRIRVATEFVVLPVRLQEEIYTYIAQLQRDRLASRIEIGDF